MCIGTWKRDGGKWNLEFSWPSNPVQIRASPSGGWLHQSVCSPCWELENLRTTDGLALSKVRKLQLCIQENLTMVGRGENQEVWKTDIVTKIAMLCLLSFCWKKSFVFCCSLLQQGRMWKKESDSFNVLNSHSSNYALYCCQCYTTKLKFCVHAKYQYFSVHETAWLIGDGTLCKLCWQNICIPIFHWDKTDQTEQLTYLNL